MDPIHIERLKKPEEAHICARFMSGSEPWITLGRSYDASLKIMNDHSKEVYLAIAGDTITGFLILQMEGAFIGYIQSVGVFSEWRGRGIGRQLLQHAEDRIFSETPNVFICVSSFNHRVMKYYKRLGYDTIGELKDYIISGHSEILLRKTRGPLTEFNQDEFGRKKSP